MLAFGGKFSEEKNEISSIHFRRKHLPSCSCVFIHIHTWLVYDLPCLTMTSLLCIKHRTDTSISSNLDLVSASQVLDISCFAVNKLTLLIE